MPRSSWRAACNCRSGRSGSPRAASGPAEIGALLAIGQWVKVAANPLTGGLADRSGDPRRFMLLLAAVCVAGYLLCMPAHGFAALTLLNALTAACLACDPADRRGAGAGFAAGGKLQYGRVRLWGTLSFILTTLLGRPRARGARPGHHPLSHHRPDGVQPVELRAPAARFDPSPRRAARRVAAIC